MPEDMPEDMSEYMPEDMSDRMPEDMSEYMPEDMPDRMPEDMSDRVPVDMSDRMPEDMSEYMPEDMPDRMPEDMSDRVPEDMPDRMPEDLPDRMPEDMPEDMPDRMPEDMPDRMSNRMSEDMSDRMPEDLPVRKCINVMVGITRSKVIFIILLGWSSNLHCPQHGIPNWVRADLRNLRRCPCFAERSLPGTVVILFLTNVQWSASKKNAPGIFGASSLDRMVRDTQSHWIWADIQGPHVSNGKSWEIHRNPICWRWRYPNIWGWCHIDPCWSLQSEFPVRGKLSVGSSAILRPKSLTTGGSQLAPCRLQDGTCFSLQLNIALTLWLWLT